MTQVKERAVEIIQRIPEEKMPFVFNILQNIEGIAGERAVAHDVLNEETDLAERQAAYQRLLKYKGTLHRRIDYKKELAEYRDEKYGHPC
jgi:DNA helicase IV